MTDHSPARNVVAIIPVGTLEGAKSRLGAVLDAEERHDLAISLARRTIESAVACPGIAETFVITPDDTVRELADDVGARPIRQRSEGLDQGLQEARAEAIAAGADAILVLPMDLPAISIGAIETILDTLDGSGPQVTIVPDRHGRGTNALLLAPPDAIDFAFGGESRAAHIAAAHERDVRLVELGGPLTLDLDTADDLLLAGGASPDILPV